MYSGSDSWVRYRIGNDEIRLSKNSGDVAAIRHSDQLVVLSCCSGTTHLIDRIGKKLLAQLPSQDLPAQLTLLNLRADGRYLLAASDRDVRLIDIREGRLLAVLKGHIASVKALTFSADGLVAYSGGEDRTVRAWDISDLVEPVPAK